MPLEPGLIGFAGLTSLALGMKKHGSGFIFPPPPRLARVLGWTLLGLAAAAAVWRFGPGIGVTAWLGQLSIAGAVLVLLMSWRPALALGAALTALACVPILGLM